MSSKYLITAALFLTLSGAAFAEDATDSGGISGYWRDIKTGWLGLAPGAKPFYFRAGYTLLAPDSSSSTVNLSNVGGPASLAIDNGPIAGSGASVEAVDFPSVILGWQMPWGDGNWALETVLALPLTVEFKADGALANTSIAPYALGNIPTGVPALGTEFGEAKVLPPVVTAVYRFLPHREIRPYVGAGLAYMLSYDAEVTNPVLTAVNQPKLEIDPAFGIAVQGGVEWKFYRDWWINLDVKFISGLDTSAKVSGIVVQTPDLPTYEVAEVGDATVDVTVDPWVYHIGVGFSF